MEFGGLPWDGRDEGSYAVPDYSRSGPLAVTLYGGISCAVPIVAERFEIGRASDSARRQARGGPAASTPLTVIPRERKVAAGMTSRAVIREGHVIYVFGAQCLVSKEPLMLPRSVARQLVGADIIHYETTGSVSEIQEDHVPRGRPPLLV